MIAFIKDKEKQYSEELIGLTNVTKNSFTATVLIKDKRAYKEAKDNPNKYFSDLRNINTLLTSIYYFKSNDRELGVFLKNYNDEELKPKILRFKPISYKINQEVNITEARKQLICTVNYGFRSFKYFL